MVSNGFINEEPLKQLLEVADAFNIDVKSFSQDFYKRVTGSSIKPVLNAIRQISASGRHLELTYLVIPGINDKKSEFIELMKWINDQCGRDIILHISRYFPHYKMMLPPTPTDTIEEFTGLAGDYLDFVYPGNTGDRLSSDTVCPGCNSTLISRNYYNTLNLNINGSGLCMTCHKKIFGQF